MARAETQTSAIRATASSEESSRTNLAANAIDGNRDTRWCANGGGSNQWLQLDFGSVQRIGGLEIDWEFRDRIYGFTIEGSTDAATWTRLAADTGTSGQRIPFVARARYIRIRVTSIPDKKWASIREITPLDFGGHPIGNARPSAPAP